MEDEELRVEASRRITWATTTDLTRYVEQMVDDLGYTKNWQNSLSTSRHTPASTTRLSPATCTCPARSPRWTIQTVACGSSAPTM